MSDLKNFYDVLFNNFLYPLFNVLKFEVTIFGISVPFIYLFLAGIILSMFVAYFWKGAKG